MKVLAVICLLTGACLNAQANENSCGSNQVQNQIISTWLEQNDPDFSTAKAVSYGMLIQNLLQHNDFLVQVTGQLQDEGYFSHTFKCDNGTIVKIQSLKRTQFSQSQDGVHQVIR